MHLKMDKETIFRVLFKCKVDGEQKFTDFSQLTPAGRRVIILVINLALGGKPKDTLKFFDIKLIYIALILILTSYWAYFDFDHTTRKIDRAIFFDH